MNLFPMRISRRRPAKVQPSPSLLLGTIPYSKQPTPVRPLLDVLTRHMAIAGGTRNGKSKLLELILRNLIFNGIGCAYFDPHGDTAEDVMAFIAYHRKRLGFGRKKLHYLRPITKAFSFDPFDFRPDPNDPYSQTPDGYECWLHTKCESMAKIIVRPQGEPEAEQQKMVRLQRWLYNGLYACGVRQGDGSHLPLPDIFILLNPQHTEHEERYARVEPNLSDEVRSDFEKLRRTKDVRKQEDWVESTLNRLRKIFGPIVKRIFNLEAETINFREIIETGGTLIVNLDESQYQDASEGHAIAGLILRELRDASRMIPRPRRRDFFLFIDEAQNYLGEDLNAMFAESGKFRVFLTLVFQDLTKLQKGDIDLVPTVLSQCDVRITFAQKFKPHAETLAESLCYPNIDFEPLVHESIEHTGEYNFLPMTSYTIGESRGTSHARQHSLNRQRSTATQQSKGLSQQFGQSHQRSLTLSAQRSQSVADSLQQSTGVTLGHSEGTSQQQSRGRNVVDSLGISLGNTVGTGRTVTYGTTRGQSRSRTDTIGTTEDVTQGTSKSSGLTNTSGTSHGSSSSDTYGQSHGAGYTNGNNFSHRTIGGPSASYGSNSSLSVNSGFTASHGHSEQSGSSQSTAVNNSESHSLSKKQGNSRSVAFGQGESESNASQYARYKNKSASEGVQAGHSEGESETTSQGANASDSVSVNRGSSRGQTRTHGQSDGLSIGNATTDSKTTGVSAGVSKSNSESFGESEGESVSVNQSHSQSETRQLIPLPISRKVRRLSGKLRRAVNDQIASFTQTIMGLPKQHCVVSIAGQKAFVMRVADVNNVFEQNGVSLEWEERAIAHLKQTIFAMHPYYFSLIPATAKSDPATKTVAPEIIPSGGDDPFPQ